jgi:CHAT domain-containing protein/Tfp pilus assembly protein PilF
MTSRRAAHAIAIVVFCVAVRGFAATHAIPPALARLADPATESYAVNDVEFVHAPRAEVENALRYFTASLDAKRAGGDLSGQAAALRRLGIIYESLGENRKALDSLRESLLIYRRLTNRREEAAVLDNLGIVFSRTGQTANAVDSFEQSLALFRQLGIRDYEASTLNNLGQASLAAGDRQAALSHLLQSLKIRRAIGDRRGEAQTLNNIGALYESIGEHTDALFYFRSALAVRRLVGDHYGQAHVLNNIGVVHISAKRYGEAARRFEDALTLLRAAGDRFGEAGALNNIGVALASRGSLREALEHYSESLDLRKSIDDSRGESLTLYNIALAHLQRQEIDDAICELEESLSIGRRIGDLRTQTVALHALAWIERERGDLPAALSLISDAVGVVESERDRIANEELRVSFTASAHAVEELYIDLLMQLHRIDAAFKASEHFRARALVGALAKTEGARRAEVDPALRERERNSARALNAAADRYTHLLVQSASKEALEAALAEVQRNKTEYAAVAGNEENALPPEFSAAEIRSQVVDRDSVLIEYSLGEDRSYVWLITSNGLLSRELPGRGSVAASARRVYALLTARNRRIRFETADEKSARVTRADAQYWPAAARLSAIVFGPIAKQLEKKRLLIVPDAELFDIPFSALPEPHDPSGRVPLVVRHEIVVLPSASALLRLRREIAGRPRGGKLIAVVADPIYSRADTRLSVHGTANEPIAFRRLEFAGEEARSILSLVPQSSRKAALDFDASRRRVLSEDLAGYRYIHFATHAFVDDVHPELSAMVLSLFDARGREQNGFLRLSDIIGMKLSADLVVLSGCRTALGREVRGEGVLGLARAFFYAGAERLVVSLWDVNDRATAELMKSFYRSILASDHRSPAAALRAAQLSLRKQGQWNAPYYWAPFTISGEPR